MVVVLNKPTLDTKLGFALESDYEGDQGHPRIGKINPDFPSYELLMEGDVIMSINDVPVSTHASAAKLIREAQGDIMLKMVTQQPRRTVDKKGPKKSTIEAKLKEKTDTAPPPAQKAPEVATKTVATDKEAAEKEAAEKEKAEKEEAEAAEKAAAEAAKAAEEAGATKAAADEAGKAAAAIKVQAIARGKMTRAISVDEDVEVINQAIAEGYDKSAAMAKFKEFDADGNGYLEGKELESFAVWVYGSFRPNAAPMSPAQLKKEVAKLLKRLDETNGNSDGKITFDEFHAYHDAKVQEMAGVVEKKQAAVKMQAKVRGTAARKQVTEKKQATAQKEEERDAAAAKVQAITRGQQSRKSQNEEGSQEARALVDRVFTQVRAELYAEEAREVSKAGPNGQGEFKINLGDKVSSWLVRTGSAIAEPFMMCAASRSKMAADRMNGIKA